VDRQWLTMAESQFYSMISDDLSPEEVNNMLQGWSNEGWFKSILFWK